MIIKEIKLKLKHYKLKNKLQTSNYIHKSRDSWIISIKDDLGNEGFGEASPISIFNNESIIESGYSLDGFKLALSDVNDEIDIEELILLSEVHTLNNPSAAFAIQTALFDLVSKINNKTISGYINQNSSLKLKCNGIYNLTSLDNYNTIKIKCGFRNLFDELELIESLSNKFNNSSFIIDLNQHYDLPKAIRFFKEVEKYNIKYIEQPIDKNNLLDIEELRYHSDIPIALDESVIDLASIEKILDQNAADIFILKPQSLGNYKNINKAIELVRQSNKIPILTCSLEGSIGRFATMHVAAINNIDWTCGLAMEKIYIHEKHSFPHIKDDQFILPKKNGLGML